MMVKGFINRDPAGEITLTDSGRAVLRAMLRAMTTPPRRFPAPWRVTELPGGYAVAVVPQKPDPLRAGHAKFSHGPILLQKSKN
jgi:hypothetical protein